MNVSNDAAWNAAASGTLATPAAPPASSEQASKPANKPARLQASKLASKPARPEAAPAAPSKQDPADLVPFSTYLPADLRKRVKIHAAERGLPVWQIVVEALEATLPRR
jgi:hypothetical protein